MTVSRHNRTLFDGEAGLFGTHSDGLVPGFSQHVVGTDSSIEISIWNPDRVGLQLEFSRDDTTPNWMPVGVTFSGSETVRQTWFKGYLYRIVLLSASSTPVIVKTQDSGSTAHYNTGFTQPAISSTSAFTPALAAQLTAAYNHTLIDTDLVDNTNARGIVSPNGATLPLPHPTTVTENTGEMFGFGDFVLVDSVGSVGGFQFVAADLPVTLMLTSGDGTQDSHWIARRASQPVPDLTEYDETVSVNTFVPAANFTDGSEYGYHVNATANVVLDDAIPVGSEVPLSATNGATVSVYSRPALAGVAVAPIVIITDISGASVADGGIQFTDSHIRLRKTSATEWQVIEAPTATAQTIQPPTVLSPVNGATIMPAATGATYAYDLTAEPDPGTITLNAAIGADGELLRIKAIGASPTKVLRVNLPDGLDGDLTAGRFIEINENNDAVTLQRFPGEYRIISSHLARTAAGAPVTPAGPHTHTLADITDSGDAAAADFPAAAMAASATEAVRGDDPRLAAQDALGTATTITGSAPLIDNANTQQQLLALGAAITALQSVLGQNLGTVATNADLEALTDVDGTAALEANDFAILGADSTDGGQTREAGVYVFDGTDWPLVPAYQFPDVAMQRPRELIPLTNGTDTYPLPGGVPTAEQLENMVVSIGGASALTRSTATDTRDWSVVGSDLIFSAAVATLFATGREAQVTYS